MKPTTPSQSTPTGANPRTLSCLLGHVAPPHRESLTRLFPVIYSDLHRIAHRYMADQPASHTLQPTALVNEAFLRLRSAASTPADQRHALALAAVAMRSILVDHARARNTHKRGGGVVPFSLSADDEPASAASPARSALSVLELDDLLTRLEHLDERRAMVVELRFFGGFTNEQIADALSLARSTVAEDWAVARAWLKLQLAGPRSAPRPVADGDRP